MEQLSKFLSRSALYLSALGLTLMTLIICWQVFARYILNSSPSWTEQAALFLMMWFILFAAAAGVREGFHIRISLLGDMLDPKKRKALNIICHIIVLVFGMFMVFGGVQLVMATWSHVIPTLGLPRGSIYIPIVVCGALIVFFSFEKINAEYHNREVKPLWN